MKFALSPSNHKSDVSSALFKNFRESYVSHCSVIKVPVSQTARLLYHIFQNLSRTFFDFFQLFRSFWNFESTLFSAILYDISHFLSFRQLIKIITIHSNCQHLFLFFWNFLNFKKRRRRDLNPRAGYPTYTLSRGTSSASWVLLQTPNS